ncbi:MAG TPA: hypothetical protein VLB90_04940 [Pseudomonadales bacterium]|nr:hypothetical protein [Pseudomonadales bacterium]
MFKILADIFGITDKQQDAAIPDSVIKAAIERTLDGTDPRMRILPAYTKTLHAPVLHAIHHVIAMVDALPVAVQATKEAYEQNIVLGTVFTSAARMNDILAKDNRLCEYLATTSLKPDKTVGLLTLERHEKTGFGYALVDEKLMNDVQQTTVSFDDHHLLDLSSSEEETRRLLKHRAFDYLLSIALAHVSEQRDEREKLTQQRTLLRVKLDILQKGGSGFSHNTGQQDHTALQTHFDEIETQLHALGPVEEVLQNNLAIVASVLNEAEKHFWGEEKHLRIDQRFTLHSDADASVPITTFHDVCDSNGRRITLLLLSITTNQ